MNEQSITVDRSTQHNSTNKTTFNTPIRWDEMDDEMKCEIFK